MGSAVKPVFDAVLMFSSYTMVAVFAQNVVLGRALGVSRLVKLITDDAMDSFTYCVLMGAVQLVSAPMAFFVNRIWLNDFESKAFVRPLVLVACTIVAFFLVLVTVAATFPSERAKRVTAVLPMATFNSAIVGTLLITTTQGFTLAQTLGFALGSALGYAFAVIVVTEGERKLQNDAIPETFRGLPITLLYLSTLSLATYGIVGHLLSF